jgi:hypothetical protein
LVSVSSGGGQNLGDVTVQVTDPNTGAKTLSVKLNAILAADGNYNDNNADTKLNSGDSFVLIRDATTAPVTVPPTAGHATINEKVQLLKGESVIGTIKALPS